MTHEHAQIVVVLPLPPAALSPNARVHYHVRARAAAQTRADAAYAAMHALDQAGFRAPPRWKRARIVYVWCVKSGTYPDPDNAVARCKPVLDGLVDAGVLSDDRDVDVVFERKRGKTELLVVVHNMEHEYDSGKSMPLGARPPHPGAASSP